MYSPTPCFPGNAEDQYAGSDFMLEREAIGDGIMEIGIASLALTLLIPET